MSTNVSSSIVAKKNIRGLSLLVGFGSAKDTSQEADLKKLLTEINRVVNEFSPGSEIQVSIALAPVEVEEDNLQIVKKALTPKQSKQVKVTPPRKTGVTVDFSRRQVLLDGFETDLTFKEFEILKFLILREGVTVSRQEILDFLSSFKDTKGDTGHRSIDVAIRRLRSKLQHYEQIVSTVRGKGYRFDRHADVKIIFAQTPSPDRF